MDPRVYAQRSRFWVQEFLVDLLGSLLPGLIFTFLITIVAIVMIWMLVRLYEHLIHDSQGGPSVRTQWLTTPGDSQNKPANSTQDQTMVEKGPSPAPDDSPNKPANPTPERTAGGKERTSWEAYKSLWETFKSLWETFKSLWETFGTEIVILVIAFSYVIGLLFLNADPRLPDARSVWVNRKRLIADKAPAIYLNSAVRGDCRLVRRAAINVIESFLGMRPRYVGQLEKEQEMDVEFPYLNMKYYLVYRNLEHLADIIPWDATDKKSRAQDDGVHQHAEDKAGVCTAGQVRHHYAERSSYSPHVVGMVYGQVGSKVGVGQHRFGCCDCASSLSALRSRTGPNVVQSLGTLLGIVGSDRSGRVVRPCQD